MGRCAAQLNELGWKIRDVTMGDRGSDQPAFHSRGSSPRHKGAYRVKRVFAVNSGESLNVTSSFDEIAKALR